MTVDMNEIPGVSIVQDVELTAPYVGWLDDDEEIKLYGWFKSDKSVVTKGKANFLEVKEYDDDTGQTEVVGFPRDQKIAKQTGTLKHLTLTDEMVREVPMGLRGTLWRKNVSVSHSAEYLDPGCPHSEGVQPTASGRYIIGHWLMNVPTEKWGLFYVDLIHQEAVT